MFFVYYPNWILVETDPKFFETIEAAIEYAQVKLAYESHPYLIGTDARIGAITFQGQTYYPLTVKVVTR